MTNKEAIEELKKVDTLDMPARLCEAHYMAIKALEQEPCDDAINRQAVIGLIADYDLSMEQVVKGIFALPPVTPQPKTGHWIDDKIGSQCSCCGIHIDRYVKFKYCPMCGARMESEDKE